MITILDDLIGFIDESDAVPAAQKAHLRSAVNRIRTLVCDGLADIRADRKVVLRRLDLLSPAMANMTPQSLANLKSRVRAAYRYATPDLAPARSHVRLKGELQALEALLPVREQRQLSRLLRFAQAMGWRPQDIDDEGMETYGDYLRNEVMLTRAESVIRATRRAWNRAVDTVPGWPERRVALPPPKRQPYWLRLEQLPISLQQEIVAHLHRLEHPDPFLGESCRIFAPVTIRLYREAFIQLASALAASGTPVHELTSVATLVRPNNLEQALRFLYARAGDRVNVQIRQLANQARKIAPHVGLSHRDLERIDEIWASVMVAATDLLALGISLMETWASGPPQRIKKASRYRDGLIIALLISCPIRMRNLASIEVGRHLVWDGTNYQLHFTAAETKTRRSYAASVPPDLTPHIDGWLQVHRKTLQAIGLAKGAVTGDHLWLDRWGKPMRSAAIRQQIETRTRDAFGRQVWPHLFRDCAVTELVDCAPEEIGIAPDLLGHADLQTTKKHYIQAVGMKAHAKVQEMIAARRRAATSWNGGGKSRA